MLTFIFPTFLGMCPNPPDVLLSWIEYFRVPDVFVSVTSYQILYIQILFSLDCTITQIQFFCCAVSMCGPLCPPLSLYLSMFTVYPQGGKSSSRLADRTDDVRLLAKTREHVVHSGVGDLGESRTCLCPHDPTRSQCKGAKNCQDLRLL